MSEENTTPENVEVTPTETPKEPVRGSLFAALNGITGEPPKEEPSISEKPETSEIQGETANDTPNDVVTEEEPKQPEGVKLSAKDIRIKRKEKAKEELTPPKQTAPEPPKVEPTPEPKEPPAPEEDLSYLSKSERDTLELLKFGESKELTDKGASKKLVDYYKQRKELIEKLKQENLDDEDYEVERDPKLARWKKQNQPPVEKEKLQEIYDERLVSKAEDRALERIRKEQEERDRAHQEHMKEIEKERLRPKVEQEVSQFSDEVLALMPEDVTKAMQSGKEWAAIEEEFPIEAPIVKSTLNEYADKAEVVVSLMDGLSQFNPNSPIHTGIKDFINEQAEIIAKKPAEKKTRNGQVFVKPSEYKGEEGTWTFERKDILKMLKKKASIEANKRIETEKKRFDAYMKRHGNPTLEQNGDSKDDNASPSVKTSPSGTPTKGGKPQRRGLIDILG
jgi:hypothetical protein